MSNNGTILRFRNNCFIRIYIGPLLDFMMKALDVFFKIGNLVSKSNFEKSNAQILITRQNDPVYSEAYKPVDFEDESFHLASEYRFDNQLRLY